MTTTRVRFEGGGQSPCIRSRNTFVGSLSLRSAKLSPLLVSSRRGSDDVYLIFLPIVQCIPYDSPHLIINYAEL
jgi:hypothetical protein